MKSWLDGLNTICIYYKQKYRNLCLLVYMHTYTYNFICSCRNTICTGHFVYISWCKIYSYLIKLYIDANHDKISHLQIQFYLYCLDFYTTNHKISNYLAACALFCQYFVVCQCIRYMCFIKIRV